ncbi:HlyD family type I secretion periplasmic adaptor subunit [Rosenbergiella nectarea]|uniref:HlyD family type I secretion periplasmic adaptor subunit n=1 Tax=Rosenbergiella nectarea TaxID=988801 RepID=UPI001F4DC1AC|nr:HlyD family type I secretion periplasmic adaptor subunit [Rosenbergiella nectarea]
MRNDKTHIIFGWLVIFLGILIVIIWAFFAPLEKGVAVEGTVKVIGDRKTVQAAISGVIEKINVSEGTRIKKNDILIALDSDEANIQLNATKQRYYNIMATLIRLNAEKNNIDKLIHSNGIPEEDEVFFEKYFSIQNNIFLTRRLSLEQELYGLKQDIIGHQSQIIKLRRSLENKRTQLNSFQRQVLRLKSLAFNGYIAMNRYEEVLRQSEALQSDISESQANISLLTKQTEESESKLIQRKSEFYRDVAADISTNEVDFHDAQQKMAAANQMLKNTQIRSPVDGSIMDLTVHTVGGVTNIGDKLMDVVPDNSKLIVEGHMDIDMIDKVHKNLPVMISFSGFNQNKTPRIDGVLNYISSDKLIDNKSQKSYYLIQALVTPEGYKMLNGKELKAGMNASVFIKTGTRSFIDYLVKPISDRAATAFTEE